MKALFTCQPNRNATVEHHAYRYN